MINDVTGDLLRDDAQALVNPVNTAGYMGKGLALQFKYAFPGLYESYKTACETGELRPGQVQAVPIGDTGRWVLNFPTKRAWREPSRIEDVQSGLQNLTRVLIELEISSVAVPPLGCGLGGLHWMAVRPLIVQELGARSFDVRLYAPTSEHYIGRRIRTLHRISGRGFAPTFPGWQDPDHMKHMPSLKPGWLGTITKVESHGSNPWTRYSITFDNGIRAHGVHPDKIAFTCQIAANDFDSIRAQFPDEQIHLENQDVPYVRVLSGAWELRYFPPAAVDIHHSQAGPCDSFSLFNHFWVPNEKLSTVTIKHLATFLEWWICVRSLGGRTHEPGFPPGP
jgi:O-acetyl-ADP-ribose deacetylase (regulator of RNase III)